MDYSDDEIRRILLEHQLVSKADETCKKYGVTRARLRDWKKRFPSVYPSLRDRMLEILQRTEGGLRAGDFEGLREWLDHADKVVYRDDELKAALEELVASGHAVRSADAWVFRPDPTRRTLF